MNGPYPSAMLLAPVARRSAIIPAITSTVA